MTRIPPELHRQVNTAAVLAGKSLNAFVSEQLQEAVQKLGIDKQQKKIANKNPRKSRPVKPAKDC